MCRGEELYIVKHHIFLSFLKTIPWVDMTFNQTPHQTFETTWNWDFCPMQCKTFLELKKNKILHTELLNLSTCADSSTNPETYRNREKGKEEQKYVMCQILHVLWHVLRFTWHLSLTLTATDTKPPPANSTIMQSRLVCKDLKTHRHTTHRHHHLETELPQCANSVKTLQFASVKKYEGRFSVRKVINLTKSFLLDIVQNKAWCNPNLKVLRHFCLTVLKRF